MWLHMLVQISFLVERAGSFRSCNLGCILTTGLSFHRGILLSRDRIQSAVRYIGQSCSV